MTQERLFWELFIFENLKIITDYFSRLQETSEQQ